MQASHQSKKILWRICRLFAVLFMIAASTSSGFDLLCQAVLTHVLSAKASSGPEAPVPHIHQARITLMCIAAGARTTPF